MTRYFVEVPHGSSKQACDAAVKAFMETGSHFMTNADWGCRDGEHKAWFIVDIDDKRSVMEIIPPFLRRDAKITEVIKFRMQDIDEIKKSHGI